MSHIARDRPVLNKQKLTPKQKKFVQEYLKCGNATEAAIKAGYSKKTARIIGCENLTKPNIAELLETKQKRYKKSMN